MRTGEGKTLVATLPVYLNALEGKGVHVVTVNDYLAKRDAEWMGKLYSFLGLIDRHRRQPAERRREEAPRTSRDITYGQNNEFGFDYLRDNMKFSALDYAQRQLNYAIVDEVDSILIDEARTPLIISGQAEAASEKYKTLNEIIPRLRKDEHYIVDEKGTQRHADRRGRRDCAEADRHLEPVRSGQPRDAAHPEPVLRAHALYKRDAALHGHRRTARS